MHTTLYEMQELNGMFDDMAMLVEEQGEVANQVERNVESAVTCVDEGTTNISEAVVENGNNSRVITIGNSMFHCVNCDC